LCKIYTFDNIPLGNNTVAEYELSIISQPAGTLIASPIIAPTGTVIANGSQITLYRPQQLQLDSLFCVNDIIAIFNITNRDLINTIRYYASVLIEIEEL